MPHKHRYHHGDLRRALLEQALSLIEAEGLEGLTLAEAAKRAGVSHTALYRHFDGREDLLVALAIESFDLFLEQLQRASAGAATALARVQALGHAYLAFATKHPARYAVMFSGAIPKDRFPALRAARLRAFALPMAAVAEASQLEAAAATRVARQAWSLCHGVASFMATGTLDGTRRDADELVRAGLAALLGAARPTGNSA